MKKRRTRGYEKHLHRAVVQTMVGVSIEKLELQRRVPEFFHRQGWPEGERVNGIAQGHAFVAGVLACYALGAIQQVMQVPAFLRLHPTWEALCLSHGADGRMTVAHIVESLSPGSLPVGHADRLDTLIGMESKRLTA